MITVLHEQRVSTHPPAFDPGTDADASGEAAALWLDAEGIEQAVRERRAQLAG